MSSAMGIACASTAPAAVAPLAEVLARFSAGGGTLIDTAPSYGPAEEVLGSLLASAALRDRVFLATKFDGGPRHARRVAKLGAPA